MDSLQKFDSLIADKVYHSEAIRKKAETHGLTPVIPRKKSCKTANTDMDWCLDKYRHLVENIFARLKHYRAIATQYDKFERNYQSMVALACCMVWLPMNINISK